MKKMFTAFLLITLLTGCSTVVPVTPKFPEPPKNLLQPCPQLETLKSDAKLSDIAKTVTKNYSLYHLCTAKVDAWLEWYESQSKIYMGIK